MGDGAIAFLSGAVTLGYAAVGLGFLRFWRRTGDALFRYFAIAFWLFALNQLLSAVLGGPERPFPYEYVLRVCGFLLIVLAIARKNRGPGAR